MSTGPIDALLIMILALNFYGLGVRRARALIRVVALQGILIGLLPLFAHEEVGIRSIVLAIAAIALKAVLIPGLLYRAIREVDLQREVKPLVGYTSSVLLGAIGTGLALEFAYRLPLAMGHVGQLLIPASFATVLTGILLLTTRQRAVMQALGYLVFENGRISVKGSPAVLSVRPSAFTPAQSARTARKRLRPCPRSTATRRSCDRPFRMRPPICSPSSPRSEPARSSPSARVWHCRPG